MMNKKTELVKTIILLPGTALVLIPALILYATRPIQFLFGFSFPQNLFLLLPGLFFLGVGLLGAMTTMSLFTTEGQGTPAPWAPPKRFVARGPYAYVRNPMILSVFSILLAESLIFGSVALLLLFLLFCFINHFYFIYVEEPGLRKRFGKDYLDYKAHVRRWIPRLTPWQKK